MRGGFVSHLDPPDKEIDEEIKAMGGTLDSNRPTIG